MGHDRFMVASLFWFAPTVPRDILEFSAEVLAMSVRGLEAVERLHTAFGFRDRELAKSLGISELTLQRWRSARGDDPTPVDLNRFEALDRFLAELDDLLADEHAALVWLGSVNK